MSEFAWLRTITIQSSLRYNYERHKTVELVKKIRARLQRPAPTIFSREEEQEVLFLIGLFNKHYLKTFYQIINPAKAISDLFPDQRDRLARKGPVGYSRDVPKPADLAAYVDDQTLSSELKRLQVATALPDLPRAIKYTGALYSIGLPPEIIGTGRGLKEADERGLLDKRLTEYYASVSSDLEFAFQFVNLDDAREFIPRVAFRRSLKTSDTLRSI